MRYCEWDDPEGCDVYDTTENMVQVGQEWYCRQHGARVLVELTESERV